ncbi:High affinity nerve growth factor receptor [Nymphaea thermarum]|nr:High affinity nerve growth factor receptor [Nymphaea thermarum]
MMRHVDNIVVLNGGRIVEQGTHDALVAMNGSYRNLRTQRTFGGNLQSVLVSLAANSSLTGYYTATTGKSPDQIYGWVQCRGDIDGEVCQICAADATSQIVKFCPNRKAALSSFHLCIMYYYGNNFSIPNWIKTFAIPSAGAIPNPPTIQAAAIVFLSEARRFGHRQYFGPVLLGRQVQETPTNRVCGKPLPRRSRMTRILKAVCYIRFDAFPFFTPLLPTIALSSANYISSNCSAVAPANLTGTTYHRNLKALFVSLIENGPLTGFFSQSPDQVYGGSDVPRGQPWRALLELHGAGFRQDGSRDGVVILPSHMVGLLPVALVGHDCGWCLQNAVSDIAGCSKGKQGALIFEGSCRLSYGLQNFLLSQPMIVLPVVIYVSLSMTDAAEKQKYNIEADDNHGNATEKDADYDLPQITLRAIQDATDNFSEANNLGEGVFGPVYMVARIWKASDGQEVAVKRLATASGQGLRELRNEIQLIAKLQHTNFVRLIGCCLGKGEKLLVYEYMPNKSLDYFLKGQAHDHRLVRSIRPHSNEKKQRENFSSTMRKVIERIPFLFLILLSVLVYPSLSYYLDTSCYGTANYSTFQRNLNQVYLNLTTNAPLTGFYAATAGEGTDQAAYGLVLCRGDDPDYVCRSCSSDAASQIVPRCPGVRAAVIWLDECLLRYEDSNFIGTIATSLRFSMTQSGNNSNPALFGRQLGLLMANLSSSVTGSASNLRFATGVIVFQG